MHIFQLIFFVLIQIPGAFVAKLPINEPEFVQIMDGH